MKDYYYLLGVSRRASTDDIKKAYRRLSLKFHPDQNEGDAFFQQRFVELQEAYDVLSDADKRLLYDMELNMANVMQKNRPNNTNFGANDLQIQQKQKELQQQQEGLQKREQQITDRELLLQQQELKFRNEQINLHIQQEQFLRLQEQWRIEREKSANTSSPTNSNASINNGSPLSYPTEESSKQTNNSSSNGFWRRTFWFVLFLGAFMAIPLVFNNSFIDDTPAGTTPLSQQEITDFTIKRQITQYYNTLQNQSAAATQPFFTDVAAFTHTFPPVTDSTSFRKSMPYYLKYLPCYWQVDWKNLQISPQTNGNYVAKYHLLIYPKDAPDGTQAIYDKQVEMLFRKDYKIQEVIEQWFVGNKWVKHTSKR